MGGCSVTEWPLCSDVFICIGSIPSWTKQYSHGYSHNRTCTTLPLRGVRSRPDTNFQPHKNIEQSKKDMNMPQQLYTSQSFSISIKKVTCCVVQDRKTFLKWSVLWSLLPSEKGNAPAGTTKGVLSHKKNENSVLSTKNLYLLEIPSCTGFKTLKRIGG